MTSAGNGEAGVAHAHFGHTVWAAGEDDSLFLKVMSCH